MAAERSGDGALGVRERQKQQTRQAIVDAAEALFSARGYDDVTVAEIAEAAGISVKTLFTYFRSKEDLVFAGRDTFLDQIVDAVRDRAPGETPLEALTAALLGTVDAGAAEAFDGFHRTGETSAGVASRLRRMWEELEEALSLELATEANEATPSPATRLVAAQLIALVRVTTSPETRAFVGRRRSRTAQERAIREAIEEGARLLAGGLGEHARRD